MRPSETFLGAADTFDVVFPLLQSNGTFPVVCDIGDTCCTCNFIVTLRPLRGCIPIPAPALVCRSILPIPCHLALAAKTDQIAALVPPATFEVLVSRKTGLRVESESAILKNDHHVSRRVYSTCLGSECRRCRYCRSYRPGRRKVCTSCRT